VRFQPLALTGAMLVELEPREDERGFFARAFCRDEFQQHGLNPTVAQANISYNRTRGTRRGFHYQRPPHAEAKLIRCVRGAVFSVMVDIRPDSSTYLKYVSAELTPENRLAIYIPEGFAAGVQTLADDTELYYQVSSPYAPEYEGGLRHDDPVLNIPWPLPATVVSEKDARWPLLQAPR
jgi:dTDP-4-dehydrorhamnose 3,5-epimerase